VSDENVRPAHLAFLSAEAAAHAPAAGAGSGTGALAGLMEQHERALVMAALERNHWRMTKTADELGLERSHLYKKVKALGIERPVVD